MTVLVRGYKQIEKSLLTLQEKKQQGKLSIIVFFTVIGLNIIGMRGGLQLRPIDVINASETVGVTNASIVMNASFSILWTLQRKTFNAHPESSYQHLNICDKGLHDEPASEDVTSKRDNVVIIVVESLSKQYISAYGGTSKTPFIDSLIRVGFSFTNAFANGRESVQGIPAVLASIPSWMDEPFIFSRYASNKVNSVASVAKSAGYNTSFFHGAALGTMGFHSFTRLVGFDDYYSMESYNNKKDFDGSWGIWDEPFLQYMAGKLSGTKQPFLAAVLTLNSHHPFKLPEKYTNKFKTKGHPVLTSIRYVDFALKQFFNRIKKEPWFKNTLFVITADHTGPNTDVLKTRMDDYRIPIIFLHPGRTLQGHSGKVASQIDIFPSVLHQLCIPANYFSFGTNLFTEECDPISINYNMNIYQCIDSTYCLQNNGKETIGIYAWQKDRLLKSNLIHDKTIKAHQSYMEKALKDKILGYQYVLQNNKMSIKPANETK